jgi:hypothetical protein
MHRGPGGSDRGQSSSRTYWRHPLASFMFGALSAIVYTAYAQSCSRDNDEKWQEVEDSGFIGKFMQLVLEPVKSLMLFINHRWHTYMFLGMIVFLFVGYILTFILSETTTR